MSQRNPEIPSRDHLVSKDWFAPAILAEGHVSDCLDAVIAELAAKRDFVAAVQHNLWNLSLTPGRDSLTALKAKLKEFDKTLTFRLGMLSPEREAPWFRPLLGDKFGPFQSTMLKEPLLGAYEVERIEVVRESIVQAWHNADAGQLFFRDGAVTLWHKLITLLAHWNEIIAVDWSGKILRVDELPERLPAELDSRMLRAFLVNVRSEALLVRRGLDALYEQLLQACEALWQAQQAKQAAKTQNPYHSTAERVRAELRERRQSAKARPVISVRDMQALKFMGFAAEFPDEVVLKKRYHELARRMHPDSPGGSEESFKMLTKAYEDLTTRLGRLSI